MLKEKVLEELKKDAKKSDSAIAKKLGCSQATVTRYRRELEEERVIWGYRAIVEPKRKTQIFITLWKTRPLSERAFELLKNMIDDATLKEFEVDVLDVYSLIDSEYTLYAKFIAKDERAFMNYIEWAVEYFEDFIVELPKIITPTRVVKESGVLNPTIDEEIRFKRFQFQERIKELSKAGK